MAHALFHGRKIGQRKHLPFRALDAGHFAVFQKHHFAGVGQKGRNVGSHEAFAHAHAHEQRRGHARGVDDARLLHAHHDHGVGAVRAAQRAGKGLAKARRALALLADEMSQHFGVGVGKEGVPPDGELILKFLKVLNDAVMDDGNVAILRKMRMSILLHGQAVRGPARVTDAGRGLKMGYIFQPGFQCCQLSLSLHHIDASRLLESHPRRIVASVFQTMQPFHKKGNGRTISAVTNDSAHKSALQKYYMLTPTTSAINFRRCFQVWCMTIYSAPALARSRSSLEGPCFNRLNNSTISSRLCTI